MPARVFGLTVSYDAIDNVLMSSFRYSSHCALFSNAWRDRILVRPRCVRPLEVPVGSTSAVRPLVGVARCVVIDRERG